jgi:hypothetical protein
LDLTYKNYRRLLGTAIDCGFRIVPVYQFLESDSASHQRIILLRHDVEYSHSRALAIARLESDCAVHSTFYFHGPHRIVFNVEAMNAIETLGHEVGYHYECLDLCGGNLPRATSQFRADVGEFRRLGVAIKTVTAHGNPRVLKQGYATNADLLSRCSELLGSVGLMDGDAPMRTDGVKTVHDSGAHFRGVGRAKHLISFLATSKPRILYLQMHPDYWSESFQRAVLLSGTAAMMRATRVNSIIARMRYWLANENAG